MKKTLLTILVLGAFTLAPIKSLAMLEVDENGNPVKKEVRENEVTTLMAPDETVTNDGSQSVEPSKPADGNVTTEPAKAVDGVLYNAPAEDELLYTTTGVEEDTYKTVSTEESSNELLAAKDEEKSLGTIIFSGGTGALLGVLGTILVLSRRK